MTPKTLTIASTVLLALIVIFGVVLLGYRGFSYPNKSGWKTYKNYQYGFQIEYMNSCKYKVDRDFGFELSFSDADGGESGLCDGSLDIRRGATYADARKNETE